MKQLIKEKAIELCIELWTWCAQTGKSKIEWPGWETYKEYIGTYDLAYFSYCWFCLYGIRKENESVSPFGKHVCSHCPLYEKFGHCTSMLSYDAWSEATTDEERKIRATIFLSDMKMI